MTLHGLVLLYLAPNIVICATWKTSMKSLPLSALIFTRSVSPDSHGPIYNSPRSFQWGLTNFDFSALWVRDRDLLTSALDVTPAYLRNKHSDAGGCDPFYFYGCHSTALYPPGTVIDYRNWHLGLGRRFRSLKLWFVLRSFGAEGFRKYIRRVSFKYITRRECDIDAF